MLYLPVRFRDNAVQWIIQDDLLEHTVLLLHPHMVIEIFGFTFTVLATISYTIEVRSQTRRTVSTTMLGAQSQALMRLCRGSGRQVDVECCAPPAKSEAKSTSTRPPTLLYYTHAATHHALTGPMTLPEEVVASSVFRPRAYRRSMCVAPLRLCEDSGESLDDSQRRTVPSVCDRWTGVALHGAAAEGDGDT